MVAPWWMKQKWNGEVAGVQEPREVHQDRRVGGCIFDAADHRRVASLDLLAAAGDTLPTGRRLSDL